LCGLVGDSRQHAGRKLLAEHGRRAEQLSTRWRHELEVALDRAGQAFAERRRRERLPERRAGALRRGTPVLHQVLEEQRIAGGLRV
jgi:hypothetical protein